MLHAEARVGTDRAARYLAQLCRHTVGMGRSAAAGHLFRAHGDGTPPDVRMHAGTAGSRRTIDLGGWGRCFLEATADALVLRAEADDEEQLRRLQEGIATRLETIGRRDRLRVVWHRDDAPPASSAETDTAPAATDARTADSATAAHATAAARHRGRTLALVGLGVLVVAAHLWLAAAGLAGAAWTEWGMNAVLLVVLVKLALIGGHGVLRRFGPRLVHRAGPGREVG